MQDLSRITEIVQLVKNCPTFNKPRATLPCLKKPVIASFPEPVGSSLHLRDTPYFSELHCFISLQLYLGLADSLLPWGFLTKIMYEFLSLSLILQVWSDQKSLEVPHYVIFPAAGYFHFLASMYSLQNLRF